MPTGDGGARNRAALRRERAAAERAARERAARRKRRLTIGAAVLVVLAVAGGSTALALTQGHTSATGVLGPEGMTEQTGTQLASLQTAATGATVQGVECNTNEQVAYHVHTHLAVYVDGALRPLTPGIGIVKPVEQKSAQGSFFQASTCYYWLHVHAQDGVIHVESPTKQSYTLGQFFAIWGQPLTSSQVAGARDTVTAYVDGKIFTGDPASITLGSRTDVQLDVGKLVSPKPVDWSKSQL